MYTWRNYDRSTKSEMLICGRCGKETLHLILHKKRWLCEECEYKLARRRTMRRKDE